MSRPRFAARLLPLFVTAFTPEIRAVGINTEVILPRASQQQGNVTETGDQGRPQVIADSADGYVVFYTSGSDIARVRRNLTGNLEGGELVVAQNATGEPSAAQLADGRIVLVWESSAGDGSGPGIAGRLFSADGDPLAAPFPVNSVTAGLQSQPDVAAIADGGFVVAWESESSPPLGFSRTLLQRRFDLSAAPLGPDSPVSPVGDDHFGAAVAALAGGGWVVAWTASTGDGRDVQFRQYAASGAALGLAQALAYYEFGDQQNPDLLGLPAGGFAAVWEGSPPAPPVTEAGEGVPAGIQARIFEADGSAPLVEQTPLVSSEMGNPAGNPALALFEPHLLLLTADGTTHPWACTIDPRTGGRIGTSILVDPWNASVQRVVAAFNQGDSLLIAWDSDLGPATDQSGSSVQVRAFFGGMVGHWRFDEGAGMTAADVAGVNDNFATRFGDATWVPGRRASQALGFSGAGWADPVVSSELQLKTAGPDGGYGVTLAAWIWLEELPSAMSEPFQSIFDSPTDDFVLYLDRDNAELRFKATLADASTQRPGIPESALAIHRWLHVAAVYETDGDYRIYLDTVQQDHHIGNSAAIRTSPGQVAAFGRDGATAQYHFNGAIDEAWVVARALDPIEIQLLRGPWIFDDGFERGGFVAWSASVP